MLLPMEILVSMWTYIPYDRGLLYASRGVRAAVLEAAHELDDDTALLTYQACLDQAAPADVLDAVSAGRILPVLPDAVHQALRRRHAHVIVHLMQDARYAFPAARSSSQHVIIDADGALDALVRMDALEAFKACEARSAEAGSYDTSRRHELFVDACLCNAIRIAEHLMAQGVSPKTRVVFDNDGYQHSIVPISMVSTLLDKWRYFELKRGMVRWLKHAKSQGIQSLEVVHVFF